MKPSVAIILASPENADNVGAVSRAMKNMALTDLRLVKPPKNWKTRGKVMAVGAYDILDKASLYGSLEEAVSDRHHVIALSRRHGNYRRDYVPFSKTFDLVRGKKRSKIAFVFGKESKGLSNEELAVCDWMTTIPTNPKFASLNLAQAVMVVCFSYFLPEKKSIPALTDDAKYLVKNVANSPFVPVTKKETKEVLSRIREALLHLGYPDKADSAVDRIQGTLDRLFTRSGLLRSEAKFFKGLSRRILKK